jgi:hypothetical protein
LIEKFKEFVNSYAKIDKIDSNILEIVNTAFKTHNKFSKDIDTEAELRISDEDLEQFCINNINDNSMIPISLDDARLGEYIKIYKDLKGVYLDNCEYLLGVLEKQVLVKEPVDDKNDNPHFALKNMGYNDLVSIETDVRNRLVNMYSQCQEQYQKGMVALYNALRVKQE